MSDLEYRIAKLEVRPGDYLVVKFAGLLTPEQAARARDDFERYVPGVRVLVIDRDVELSILAAAEIARMSAA